MVINLSKYFHHPPITKRKNILIRTRDISNTKPLEPINYMGSYTSQSHSILDNDNRYEEEKDEQDKQEVAKLIIAIKAFYNCQSHSITLKH